MPDPSEIQYAEELLRHHLMEWRDAGGHIESVSGAILGLIVARERFAAMVKADPETCCDGPAKLGPGWHSPHCKNAVLNKGPALETSPAPQWIDFGSLDNGRCSFAHSTTKAACKLPAGHEGDHASDYCEHGFLRAKRCPRCLGG